MQRLAAQSPSSQPRAWVWANLVISACHRYQGFAVLWLPLSQNRKISRKWPSDSQKRLLTGNRLPESNLRQYQRPLIGSGA
jgi:hypothetical protein